MSAVQICLVTAAIVGLNGCVHREHIASAPPPATSASSTPQPAVTSQASPPSGAVPAAVPKPGVATQVPSATNKQVPPAANKQDEPPVAKTPAPVAKTPGPVAKAPNPAVNPNAATPVDLNGLKNQLKETSAIGLFTKISLKNQVDDLLSEFRKYHQGKSKTDMPELHRSYNLLLMKVLSLVQNKDPKLASTIVSSREAIWGLLSDPKKFATLEV